ncbi:MAG: high-affinity branched-chain amino acid ABC transporter permease LivM [Anaerolineales bacterium]|jgi:ABC-type branched-subunit amino acid transport system permease subunit
MMPERLRKALTTGAVFAVVLVFLVLIGFQVTAAQLIGSLLGNAGTTAISGRSGLGLDMLIFFALIGLWAGMSAAPRRTPDLWSHALEGAALAGGLAGMVLGLLAFLVAWLNAAGVQMSTYLAQLVPSTIKLFTLNLSASRIALLDFVLIVLSALLGAVLARGVIRASWPRALNDRLGRPLERLLGLGNRAIHKASANRISRYGLYGLILLFALMLPQWIGPFWNYTLGTVGIYVLLGLGLNVVVGLAGLLDLGYVAFYSIGAYTVALLTAPQPHHLLWSFWIALPIGIAVAALSGVLLGVPVLRLRGDYLAIVTLGFGEILGTLARSDALTSFTGGPMGIKDVAGPTLFGRTFASGADYLYLMAIGAVVIIFITMRLQNSRVGRAWVAMREDETVARAMGVNTLVQKLLAFGIGAAFAGLGGVFFASRNQFTGPDDYTIMVSINVLCLVIVGGMGNMPGVIAGALVLKGLPEVLRQLEDYRLVAFGALLVVMMIVRPEGILPSRRRRLEMHADESLPEPEKTGSPSPERATHDDVRA